MSAMYNFLFDRKSLALVLCGLALGGGMLFFAGVLVGVYWSLPDGTTIQAAAPPRPAPLPAREITPTAAPPPVAPDPPSPVALTSEPVSPTSAIPAIPAISAVSAALAAAEGRPAPATVPSSAIPTGPTIELPTGPAPEEIPSSIAGAGESIGLPKTAPMPPAPPTPPMPQAPPAPAAAATPALPEVASGEGRYTIQVGAFSQVANSEETVAELSRQGYAPYVVEVQGTRGVLHVVRVGRYSDRGSAARAASDLRRKARMEAIVQRTPGEGSEKAATSG
jgi:cell division septation protein DedD